MTSREKIIDTAKWLHSKANPPVPQTAVVLGSGLGILADELKHAITVEMCDIPHWPVPTVKGHLGRLVFGSLADVPVIIQQGRIHFYEGHSIQDVVFPVRVLKELGVKILILTNASGGLNPDFNPGDLMVVTDHLNLMFANPLIGPNESKEGDRFPDMSTPYDIRLRKLAFSTAGRLGIGLKKGVLVATTGPSYETAAEVRMMRMLGGDCVCMSTVPEVIAGVHMGLYMLAISCITNMATGLSENRLSHEEVEQTAGRIKNDFIPLLREIVASVERCLGDPPPL